MTSLGCSHNILEKVAKFCSECGQKLSVQPANTQDTGDQSGSLAADLEGTAEKSESQRNDTPVDSKDTNKSCKQQNDETISTPKKKTKSEEELCESLKINHMFGKVISDIIRNSWPKDHQGKYEEDEELVFQHILSWAATKDIFQLHDEDEKLIERLSEDARDRIAVAILSFTAISDQLVSGDIKISLLNIILEKRNTFLDLLTIECLSQNEQYKVNAKMRGLLQCRENEVKAVYHEKEVLDAYLTMSDIVGKHMTIDVAGIRKRNEVNIEILRLNDFMEVHPFDQLSSPMAGVITYFDLDEEIRDMAKVLHTFRDSYLFKAYWEYNAKSLAAGEEDEFLDINATPEMIHELIFKPCFADYKELYTCLKNGSMELFVVNLLVGDYSHCDFLELEKDLDIMCRVDNSSDKQWIHSRVQQIHQSQQLRQAMASAKTIMKVKEVLHLQGDFSVLEPLVEANQLNQMNKDLMQAKINLVDFTEDRRLHLNLLGQCGGLLKWIRDTFEDLNEVQVFADQAHLSEAQKEGDVKLVTDFHDAVRGYSSVIYELKPDAGFHAFKEVLKKFWITLEYNSHLTRQLLDSFYRLEWLQALRERVKHELAADGLPY